MQSIKRDTSYTVKSVYLKYKKRYKNIKEVRSFHFKNVSESHNIKYKSESSNDQSCYMDAYFNTDSNYNPIVVLIHGGGWKSGDKNMMQPLAQYIASKGYTCFAVNYRLSGEALYPKGIYDIKEAIRFIKDNASKYHANDSKVAVLGCSSGAQMASLIGVTNNNPKFESYSKNATSSSVQAVINIDGVLAFKHPESKEGTVASLWLGGTYEEKPEVWKEASALTHVDKNSPPILFINSQHERFHAGRDDMIKILNQYDIYNQVITLSDSPHSFWLFYPWFNDTVKHITTFLDNTLKKSNP
ncbi:alpha/beta hydrolase fold domain-containing protein [Mesoflavibacter zeaxanthinifaciens]|uniref:alpha/beta hydrolase fold domain-containing protein n=1 Tax=Mesoflavibacter zeaxanthinifaciens TaxID=393060 RepID=UPI003A8E0089